MPLPQMAGSHLEPFEEIPLEKSLKKLTLSLAGAILAVTGAVSLFAQEFGRTQPLKGYYLTEPWKQGTHSDAASQSLAGTTIPLFTYSFAATKDNSTRSGTMVGTSPFVTPLTGSTTPVVIVPLKITIGSTVYDPTAANTCDSSVSTVTRLQNSPLIANSSLTMNGVNVGNTQFINGFRRAEFWSKVAGSATYNNTLSPVTVSATQSLTAGVNGSNYSSGCTGLGIVGYNWISGQLSTLLANLTASGVVGPTKFVVFLVKNVVQSTANPPGTSGCCILGFHSAKGNPVQTYAITDWDTTGLFTGTRDGSIAAHEIGEWMDDPLGTNPTPGWGNIGQVSGCQSNLENGDPLSGNLMPTITLSGYGYHMQELGFFSWYFNKLGAASLGSGGKFSSNGKFAGPSKVCPPGGTN